MNYGFAPATGDERPRLEPADEPDRYCIQLYHHVATQVDIRGMEALEVSSGRGGGASYIQRYLRPRATVGLDFSASAVRFCRRCHLVEGLSFQTGDAENLPFDGNVFDVVVNVEASHCYGSMDAFLSQIGRVLRPGGYFLYADFRSSNAIDSLSQELARAPLELVGERDITSNVLEALRLDSQRKQTLIEQRAGPVLRQAIEEFAAVEGSRMFRGFLTRERIYKSFVLRKR